MQIFFEVGILTEHKMPHTGERRVMRKSQLSKDIAFAGRD